MLTLIQTQCGQMGATESDMFDEVSSETRRKGVCYPSLRSLWTYEPQRSGYSGRPLARRVKKLYELGDVPNEDQDCTDGRCCQWFGSNDSCR